MRPLVTKRERAQFAFTAFAACCVGMVLTFGDESVPSKVMRALCIAPAYWFGVRFLCIWRIEKVPGHCPACGYELTGLDDGAVCPECGKPAKETPA